MLHHRINFVQLILLVVFTLSPFVTQAATSDYEFSDYSVVSDPELENVSDVLVAYVCEVNRKVCTKYDLRHTASLDANISGVEAVAQIYGWESSNVMNVLKSWRIKALRDLASTIQAEGTPIDHSERGVFFVSIP